MGELVVLRAAQQNEGMKNVFVPKRGGFVPKPVFHVSLAAGNCFKFNLGALLLCRVDVPFPRQADVNDSAQKAAWPQTVTDPWISTLRKRLAV